MEKQTQSRGILLEAAKEAATQSGVYLMKDAEGAVIYVGKAKNLRNRLVTYFQGEVHEIPRTELMVLRVARFDVILTETESEALILECTLIKRHKPRFNVRLKDDKAYPYLKLRMDEPFPRIEWTRRVLKDGARYFGPFPSAWAARETMRLLNEAFKLRDCSDNTFRHRSRPCILHSIGRCSAPCVGIATPGQYRESVEEAARVLEGKADKLTRELRRGMEEAAEREAFEEAALYRDSLKNLELVTQTQSVVDARTDKDQDVAAIARPSGPGDAHGVLMQVRGGKLVAVRHYHLQNADAAVTLEQALFDFLAQAYVELERGRDGEGSGEGSRAEVSRPQEVLVAVAPRSSDGGGPELLEKTHSIGVRVPENDSETRLVNVAQSNAQYALEQAASRAGGHGIQALEQVHEKLQLQKIPHRIECYDISNTQGDEAVASRVVFVDAAPDKNLYRRYKIRTVEGSNDFAMMKEVLSRRLARAGEPGDELPELIVVDGGKGQLGQAVAILDELGVQGVEVVGLAKARTESDFKSTEVKSSHERIFIPGRKNPVALLPHTDAYKLLVHVRDEAHRFAVSYHRLLRGKKSLASSD